MTLRNARAILAIVAAITVSACASVQRIDQAGKQADQNAAEATSMLSLAAGGKPSVSGATMPYFEVKDEIWLGSDPNELAHSSPVKCEITFAPSVPVSLLQFSQTVSNVCGFSVRVTPDALVAVRQSGTRSDGQEAPAIPAPPGVTLPPPVLGGQGGNGEERIGIRYGPGDVAGLLDATTARLGLSWRHEDGVVTIFHVDTRNYKVHAIPTRTRMDSVVTSGTTTSSGIGGGSSGGAGGSSTGGVSGSSGSSQTTTVSMDASFSEDLSSAVESMLTPGIGRMFLAPSTQTLTITDTPEVLDRVGAYIADLNRFATKQVLLNVKVVSVTTNDSDEVGINWNLVYEDLARSHGIGLSSAFAGVGNAVTGSINILEGSRFDGSSLVVQALAKRGSVSILTQPSVTTLNLESVPVQVAKQTSFLASVQIAQTANVGSTSALTPGTVTTGFNMNLLPYILPDDQTVLLQYSINLSTLNNIRRVESGGSAIEIPEIDNRIFAQKVRIQSGETLVLSGFEQNTDSTDKSGVGSPSFWLAGGGGRRGKQRDVLVVLITPIVLR